jgi:hypothetical protein
MADFYDAARKALGDWTGSQEWNHAPSFRISDILFRSLYPAAARNQNSCIAKSRINSTTNDDITKRSDSAARSRLEMIWTMPKVENA